METCCPDARVLATRAREKFERLLARRPLSCVRMMRVRRLCSVPRLHAAYNAALASGRLRPDASQQRAVNVIAQLESSPPGPEGVYLCGEVGSGKSMVMDLMYESSSLEPRARHHFHEFMLQVHARLHAVQEARPRTIVLTDSGLPVNSNPNPNPYLILTLALTLTLTPTLTLTRSTRVQVRRGARAGIGRVGTRRRTPRVCRAITRRRGGAGGRAAAGASASARSARHGPRRVDARRQAAATLPG